nr:variable surface lipoprotein [Mycoplasmopsis bovis]
MKKSKFLLLGSVASLASIPFVAAKCGETKEEKKPEAVKIQIKDTKTQAKNPSNTQSKEKKPEQGHQNRAKTPEQTRTRTRSR